MLLYIRGGAQGPAHACIITLYGPVGFTWGWEWDGMGLGWGRGWEWGWGWEWEWKWDEMGMDWEMG